MKKFYKQLPQQHPKKGKEKRRKFLRRVTSWWNKKRDFTVLRDDTQEEDELSEESGNPQDFDCHTSILIQTAVRHQYQATQGYRSSSIRKTIANEPQEISHKKIKNGHSRDRSFESLDSLPLSYWGDDSDTLPVSNVHPPVPKHLFEHHLHFMENRMLTSQKFKMEAWNRCGWLKRN